MAFIASLSGLTPDTPGSLVLDAGVIVLNANMELYVSATTPAGLAYNMATDPLNTWTFEGNLMTPKKLGATRGGTTIRYNKEERQVEADGRRTNIRGFQRVDMIDAGIDTTLIQVNDLETLQLALGSTDVESLTNFYKIRPRLLPTTADYFANITLFATINGAVDALGRPIPIAIVLENGRANTVENISFTDKNEAEIPLSLTAHSLPENATQPPIYFLLPKATGDQGYYA